MSEKTEQPTPKRLRDAREKGDIPKGQDIAPAAVVLALAIYLIANAQRIFRTLADMADVTFRAMSLPFDDALSQALPAVIEGSLDILLPPLGLIMGAALASLLAETGFLFAPKAAMPKLENLSPLRWFKRVFSMKNLFDFAKNILKVLILGWIVWMVFAKHLPDLFRVPDGGLGAMWAALGSGMSDFLLMTCGAFSAIAALDFLYNRYKWKREHMMSMEEVKQEYKESEGDPQIKGQRRQLQRELMNQNALSSVRKAKVLVTNPTHYAVAIDYDAEKTPLPVILAKGEGALAQRMIEVAKEEGIPIMRNVPLARALFRDGTEQGYIPKDLIGPVAEVLRWVQSLEDR